MLDDARLETATILKSTDNSSRFFFTTLPSMDSSLNDTMLHEAYVGPVFGRLLYNALKFTGLANIQCAENVLNAENNF